MCLGSGLMRLVSLLPKQDSAKDLKVTGFFPSKYIALVILRLLCECVVCISDSLGTLARWKNNVKLVGGLSSLVHTLHSKASLWNEVVAEEPCHTSSIIYSLDKKLKIHLQYFTFYILALIKFSPTE